MPSNIWQVFTEIMSVFFKSYRVEYTYAGKCPTKSYYDIESQ